MSRSLATRIAKIEAQSRPADAAFFLVWPQDEARRDEVAQHVMVSCALPPGTRIVSEVWPHADDLPAPRWIRPGQLADREEEVLFDEVERIVARSAPGENAARSDPRLDAMSDEGLIALALSRTVLLEGP
jgi:hypothetical protein